MAQVLKIILNRLFYKFGLQILSLRRFSEIIDISNKYSLLVKLINNVNSDEFILKSNPYWEMSKSQLGQDLIGLHLSKFKKNGYFVEIGAAGGVGGSNTFLMEKALGWTGILSEPNKNYHKKILQNRSAQLDKRCLYSKTGEFIEFTEMKNPMLSTITIFQENDGLRLHRKVKKKYTVETVTLSELLLQHNAPYLIDFLSIDTEGSEFEIIKDFDFSQHKFGFICLEHNWTENESKLDTLLTNQGYKRIYKELSCWDSWYTPIS